MKKIIVIVLLASFLGLLFAFSFYKSLDNDINLIAKSQNNDVIAFQIGVFNNYDNALLMAQGYDSAAVIKDNNVYRVYIAIANSSVLIQKYKDYLNNLKIDYFCKKITISETFNNYLIKYEKLILASDDIEIYKFAWKDIINEFIKDEL